MTRIALLGLTVGLMAAATGTAEDKPGKLDPAKLLGDWTITEGTKAGEKAPDAGKGVVTMTKDKITLKSDDMTFVFAYKLDDKASPAAVDLEMLEPEAFGKPKAKGILKYEMEKVTLAYHPMGGDRPKDFTSTKDNGVYMFVMKKKETKKEEK